MSKKSEIIGIAEDIMRRFKEYEEDRKVYDAQYLTDPRWDIKDFANMTGASGSWIYQVLKQEGLTDVIKKGTYYADDWDDARFSYYRIEDAFDVVQESYYLSVGPGNRSRKHTTEDQKIHFDIDITNNTELTISQQFKNGNVKKEITIPIPEFDYMPDDSTYRDRFYIQDDSSEHRDADLAISIWAKTNEGNTSKAQLVAEVARYLTSNLYVDAMVVKVYEDWTFEYDYDTDTATHGDDWGKVLETFEIKLDCTKGDGWL